MDAVAVGAAAHALAGLPRSASPLPPSVGAAPTPPEAEIPEPNLTRLRRLILADRLDEASAELRLLPASPTVLGTIAWIDWRTVGTAIRSLGP